MITVFKDVLNLLGSGLPPGAAIALTAMVLDKSPSLTVNQIVSLAGLMPGEVDHAAITIRSKKFGTYKSGLITLTDSRLLKMIEDVKAAEAKLVEPDAEFDSAVATSEVKPKKKAKVSV